MIEEGAWVLVTTCHRDVWYGRLVRDAGDVVVIDEARHCHSWGQVYGLSALAAHGPGPGHRISDPAPRARLRDTVAVIQCSDVAVEVFAKAGWYERDHAE